jgi:PKHD-type hydroxylase
VFKRLAKDQKKPFTDKFINSIILNALMDYVKNLEIPYDEERLIKKCKKHKWEFDCTGHNSNFYKWHSDSDVSSLYLPSGNKEIDTLKTSSESIRKLSISVQLSDPSDYEGGELQIMDASSKVYTVPKEKGTVVVFDSRSVHRVRRIKSGERKSLVGWVVGPRWK